MMSTIDTLSRKQRGESNCVHIPADEEDHITLSTESITTNRRVPSLCKDTGVNDRQADDGTETYHGTD